MREGIYRAFERGVAKALMRSNICSRLDDELAEHIRLWSVESTGRQEAICVETEDLNSDEWLRVAHDLLDEISEPHYPVLTGFGYPVVGAICSSDAVIDLLKEILSQQESASVLCLSKPGGFFFGVYEMEYSQYGKFSISAWGAMKHFLVEQLKSESAEWHTVDQATQT